MEERAFFAQAADFRIRSGVTIPIQTANGSMSMFTLASEKPTIDLDREIDAVATAGSVGQPHARISFLQTTPTVEDAAWLDPKEATYLRWIAVGMTMEEIADLEGVKYNSVRVKRPFSIAGGWRQRRTKHSARSVVFAQPFPRISCLEWTAARHRGS